MNKIKVRLRSSGATIEIEESAFDATLHEKITPTRTVGEMDAAEFMQGMSAAVTAGVQSGLSAAGLTQPDRSGVVVPPARGTTPRVTGVMPAWADERRYRQLPEWEREIRNADVDHACQLWLRGVANNNFALIARAADLLYPENPQMRAALAEGAAATGGNLIPTPLASLIIEKKEKLQVIGPRSMVMRSPNQVLQVPTEATKMTATQAAEASSGTGGDPTFGQVDLTKRKIVAKTSSSLEFLEDTPFNVVTILTNQAARAIALQADVQDATGGNGTPPNQTDAIGNNGSIAVVNAAVGAVLYTDITALFYALLSQYRSNAVWKCNNAMLEILAGIRDTTGRPLLTTPANGIPEPLTGGQGAPGVGTILNRPVLEAPFANGELFFGDLQFYGVLEDPGIRVRASEHVLFATQQIAWDFTLRRDGAVLQAEAFKKSQGITAFVP